LSLAFIKPFAAGYTLDLNLFRRQGLVGLPLKVFHIDRGSQYIIKRFKNLLESCGIRSSIRGMSGCWDNAVVERFIAV